MTSPVGVVTGATQHTHKHQLSSLLLNEEILLQDTHNMAGVKEKTGRKANIVSTSAVCNQMTRIFYLFLCWNEHTLEKQFQEMLLLKCYPCNSV